VEFPSRQFFHLMINSTIGEDTAVETIIDALTAVQRRQGAPMESR
jgi:hypothetical protein